MNLINITPVLPSLDIDRDVAWYKEIMDFELVSKDKMYAVLKREKLFIHLQWHADTEDDPLLGGSVIKIFVEDTHAIFQEMAIKGAISQDKSPLKTAWNTIEFGVYDLNKNAIFIVESIK